MLQYVVICCSVLQCVAACSVCCNVWQSCNVMQCVALLKCAAMCCSELQCVAARTAAQVCVRVYNVCVCVACARLCVWVEPLRVLQGVAGGVAGCCSALQGGSAVQRVALRVS